MQDSNKERGSKMSKFYKVVFGTMSHGCCGIMGSSQMSPFDRYICVPDDADFCNATVIATAIYCGVPGDVFKIHGITVKEIPESEIPNRELIHVLGTPWVMDVTHEKHVVKKKMTKAEIERALGYEVEIV